MSDATNNDQQTEAVPSNQQAESDQTETVQQEQKELNYYLSTTGNIYKALIPLNASDSQLLHPSSDIDQHLSKDSAGQPLPTFHNLVEDRSMQASLSGSADSDKLLQRDATSEAFETARLEAEKKEEAAQKEKREAEIQAAQAEKEKQNTEQAASRSRSLSSRLQSSANKDSTGDESGN